MLIFTISLTPKVRISPTMFSRRLPKSNMQLKLVLGIFFWILLFFKESIAISVEDGSEYSGDNETMSSTQLILISMATTCSMVLIVVGCSWAWWVRLCRRRRGEVTENGYVVNSDPGQRVFSELMVRDLERQSYSEPVIFEPFPTLSNFENDSRHSFELRTSKIPGIVPVADEANMYVHDWFEPKHQNFPRGNIEYLKVVGKGWFGKVIEAEATNIVPFSQKVQVSVKLLREDASDQEQIRFLNESRMYRDATHTNILKMLGHCIEESPYILIMEHWSMGDLKSFLLANKARSAELYTQGILIQMALDVAHGLEWMESAGFVHGDLAARNCMVCNAGGKVVIGDYGLGPENYREDYYWSGNIAIPLRWAAPETIECASTAIKTLKVTKKSNIWTFGVVLWELFEFGKSPYYELSDEEIFSKVIEARNYVLERPIMNYAHTAFKNKLYNMLVISCWVSHPDARGSITDIIHMLSTPTEL